jgi:hypothetical protein
MAKFARDRAPVASMTGSQTRKPKKKLLRNYQEEIPKRNPQEEIQEEGHPK